MARSGFTSLEIQAITHYSKQLVQNIAPTESELFDEFLQEYLDARSKQTDGGMKNAQVIDGNLMFTGEELSQILTPTVISATIVGISKIIELVENKKKSQKGKPELLSKKEQPDSNLIVDLINYPGLRRELFELLRKDRVGEKRAKLIVDEFIALVVEDPNILVRAILGGKDNE